MHGIKARLIHFETEGDIIRDFVEARLKKASAMRGAIHTCFYAQCVIAAACALIGAVLSEGLFGTLFAPIAGFAVIVIAFFALGGGMPEKIISCIISLVYAVVCFITGGTGMIICGALMLAAAATAAASAAVYYYLEFLLNFPPLKLRAEHYTLKEGAYIQQSIEPEPAPEPEPQKSELMQIAEQYMELLK